VYIADITEKYCLDEQEVLEVMKIGNSNRATATTNMNDESSRSHSLFALTLIMTNNAD
jgi:hypothetical protein